MEPEPVIAQIRAAFASTPRPHDAFMANSREGCEPEESVAEFRGRDWTSLDAAMLDANYTSLSFFSEGALRYFLPAYLVADVRRELKTADPVFALTHGFWGFTSERTLGGRAWTQHHGGDTPLNPKRYGGITWRDYARYRLSVFSREESAAIVSFLRFRQAIDADQSEEGIAEALGGFWLERAERAPTSAQLAAHVAAEDEYMEAWKREHAKRTGGTGSE